MAYEKTNKVAIRLPRSIICVFQNTFCGDTKRTAIVIGCSRIWRLLTFVTGETLKEGSFFEALKIRGKQFYNPFFFFFLTPSPCIKAASTSHIDRSPCRHAPCSERPTPSLIVAFGKYLWVLRRELFEVRHELWFLQTPVERC